jgi:hypothetical protein
MGVLVLGMHRSGTSTVTLALHRLGLSLGDPADLMPPGPHKPGGYWESSSLTRFNGALLTALGGSWFLPPALAPGWERHPRLAGDLERAKEVFDRVYDDGPWVWKDPRNCLVAPFWYLTLPADPAVVLVFRHPRHVRDALERGDGLNGEQALALWERYVRDALRHAAGRPVLVTESTELLRSPEAWFDRAREFLALLGAPASPVSPNDFRQDLGAVGAPGYPADDADLAPGARALHDCLLGLRGVHARLGGGGDEVH